MRPCYQVAVASDAALPSLASSLFEQIGELDPEIKRLRHQLDHAQPGSPGLEAEVTGLQDGDRVHVGLALMESDQAPSCRG